VLHWPVFLINDRLGIAKINKTTIYIADILHINVSTVNGFSWSLGCWNSFGSPRWHKINPTGPRWKKNPKGMLQNCSDGCSNGYGHKLIWTCQELDCITNHNLIQYCWEQTKDFLFATLAQSQVPWVKSSIVFWLLSVFYQPNFDHGFPSLLLSWYSSWLIQTFSLKESSYPGYKFMTFSS
jgi:hypothetical protein